MLYQIYETLNINLFQYITFRAGVGFFVAFISSLLAYPLFIKWAKAKKANQPISKFVAAHENKKDTPTMGGIVFVVCAIIAAILCADFTNSYILIGIATLLGFGLIGARDDYMKISAKSNAGMSAKAKMAMLLGLAALLSFWMCNVGHDGYFYIPFMKDPLFHMHEFMAFEIAGLHFPLLSIAFWVLVFVATANAVNITDGLDGLACAPSIFALISLSVFVYIAGHAALSSYLYWPRVVNAGELVVLSTALIGALVGFLWYNCHPAQVFMGDSGSLALGGFLAYMAIVSNNEVLLILIGIIFVVETLSVILQVGSYKWRNKRVFLMAPIHHHYEKKGWAENKIIVRFWIISMLANLIAILTLKIR